jgi:hypothetical protein
MSINETTRLALLQLATTILIQREYAVVTTEKVVEEAAKLEAFVAQRPRQKPAKTQFLTEDTK